MNFQKKNGTRVFKLPMKAYWRYAGYSEPVILATYKSGYVRRLLTNSGVYGGAGMYQLNKRYEGKPEYFKDYETTWHDDGTYTQKFTGKYRKFETRGCKLIPVEIDRLEYLLKYCVKNYYIKHANQVPNGEFYPKWMYDSHKDEYKNRASEVNDLQNKLATINRISDV